jgi:gamma-glutamyltranspeptidase/glutathione hydrolase
MTIDSSNFEATAKNGMVTASHPLAAQAGLEIMKRGGNAIDAAIATAFVLTVVDPCMCSIAGRGEMNIYTAGDCKVRNLEFVAECGGKARPNMFEVLPREPGSWWKVKEDANDVGYQSICVPTALSGLCIALDTFGTLELGDVIQPAIMIADNGFEVDARLEDTIDSNFEKLMRFPATARIFCPQGRPLMRGETLYMKDYATTLNKIATEGPDVFYKGELAEAIVKDMDAHGGLVTEEDLANYATNITEPKKIPYREYEVVSGSPYCSGGRLVLQSLNILEHFDLVGLGETSPQYVHLLAEAFKRAFADRLEYEADPNFTRIPADGMLSKEYAAELKDQISLDKATQKVAPGNPWRYQDGGRSVQRSSRPPRGGSNTTHLCTADKEGNMVALTETLCGGYGSGVTIPGTGIIMNNGMYWFNPVPGSSNSIQPGKRHVANMAATLVLKDGEAMLATGSAGGRRILTTVTEMLIRALDFKQGVQAVASPRFHIEDEEPIQIEQSFYEKIPLAHSLVRALGAMGHRIDVLQSICIGCMITRDLETGMLQGAAEPRQHRLGLIRTY